MDTIMWELCKPSMPSWCSPAGPAAVVEGVALELPGAAAVLPGAGEVVVVLAAAVVLAVGGGVAAAAQADELRCKAASTCQSRRQ